MGPVSVSIDTICYPPGDTLKTSPGTCSTTEGLTDVRDLSTPILGSVVVVAAHDPPHLRALPATARAVADALPSNYGPSRGSGLSTALGPDSVSVDTICCPTGDTLKTSPGTHRRSTALKKEVLSTNPDSLL